MSDARHHRAHAPGPAIVFVEVPVAGSPEPSRAVKPRYPQRAARQRIGLPTSII